MMKSYPQLKRNFITQNPHSNDNNRHHGNIIPYLGESTPYFSIPENSIFRDHKIETEIREWNFENENDSQLIKLLFSLGSLSLYKILSDDSKGKMYFLGEKIRIRKLSYREPKSVIITSESFLESERK